VINCAAAPALAQGASLLVFPEGRTWTGGGLLPFKPGAFVIAVTNGVPVVPVTVHGTDRVWPPGRLPGRGATVRRVISLPVPTVDLGPGDVPRLRDRVQAVIVAHHRALLEAQE
jgi:1-acyl-sn-glycerol-3-phosphate acyltransferase